MTESQPASPPVRPCRAVWRPPPLLPVSSSAGRPARLPPPQQPLATTSGGGPGRYVVVTSAPVVVPVSDRAATAMGIYERQQRHHHLVTAGVWGPDPFRPDAADMPMVPTVTIATPSAPVHGVVEAEDVKLGKRLLQAHQDDVGVPASMEGGGEAAPPSSDSFGHDDDDDDYANARPPPRDNKSQRRLAQNREAARKSRLRKKAYIQNLETSRMKLAQLEQELTMARRHHHQVQVHARTTNNNSGVYGPPPPPPVDPRIAAFEQEYSHWVEEQERQATELRALLQSSPSPPNDLHLGVLVDAAVAHYGALFEAKARAARCDAFFVLSGVWRAPADRFFLWIGGFRPSDLLAVLTPHLGPLADHQAAQVDKLRNTARQLEEALAQGLVKLQQTLMETLLLMAVTVDVEDGGGGGYKAARERREMAEGAVGKLGDLVDFVEKADHLRHQTLRNMRRILTPWQAARGVLALAEYGQRLRALSSLWAARPREPA